VRVHRGRWGALPASAVSRGRCEASSAAGAEPGTGAAGRTAGGAEPREVVSTHSSPSDRRDKFNGPATYRFYSAAKVFFAATARAELWFPAL
jgi:hypothetical protein